MFKSILHLSDNFIIMRTYLRIQSRTKTNLRLILFIEKNMKI